MTACLSVDGVVRRFDGVLALDRVSLTVPAGTACALVGPNGAGKSTLCNLITGVIAPDAGRVQLEGRDLAGLSTRRIASLGLIRTFQGARVFGGMTVLENALAGHHRKLSWSGLAAALRVPGAWREERALRTRAGRLLDLVGLGRLQDEDAGRLPMGARKLLEVVRALLAQPRLLLLDEPSAGLDAAGAADLAALLCAARDSGVTLLVVEHDLPLVATVADQVVTLDAGRVVDRAPA